MNYSGKLILLCRADYDREAQKIMKITIYGLTIECRTASSEFAAELVRPFHYFIKNEGTPALTILVKEEAPPYSEFPTISSSFSSPRNIVYTAPNRKIIDYFGKGVVVHEEREARYTLYSRDRNFLMEAFYLLALSLLGQYCDSHSMMRVHALALSYDDTAFLMPIPPGGGKSTMALSLLQDKDIKLISDDEPIYDSSGKILPFPLRIGTLNRDILSAIPEQYVYSIERMEFGKKSFIDCAYWDAQIERRHLSHSVLFKAQRVLNGTAGIRPIPKFPVFKTLMRDAVIGIGLYQGVEFLFSHSSLEVVSKCLLAVRRMRLAVKLLRASQTYQLTLSNDIQENSRVLGQFIKNFPTE